MYHLLPQAQHIAIAELIAGSLDPLRLDLRQLSRKTKDKPS